MSFQNLILNNTKVRNKLLGFLNEEESKKLVLSSLKLLQSGPEELGLLKKKALRE